MNAATPKQSCGPTSWRPDRRARGYPVPRRGLTVLELLIAIGVLGAIGGLLLPAMSVARESARRTTCVSQLRELGLGLHNHHTSLASLPVGWQFDPTRSSAFGWIVPTLPFLDQGPLRDRIDCSKPVHAPVHQALRSTSLEFLLCPSDITEESFMLYRATGEEEEPHDRSVPPRSLELPAVPLVELPTSNYVGVFGTLEPDDTIPAPPGDGAFLENRRTRFVEFQRGLSQTLLVGERTMAQIPSTWLGMSLAGEDAAARVVGSALEGLNNPWADECDFSSRHVGGVNFLWADGHVRFVGEEIDLETYHQLARLRP